MELHSVWWLQALKGMVHWQIICISKIGYMLIQESSFKAVLSTSVWIVCSILTNIQIWLVILLGEQILKLANSLELQEPQELSKQKFLPFQPVVQGPCQDSFNLHFPVARIHGMLSFLLETHDLSFRSSLVVSFGSLPSYCFTQQWMQSHSSIRYLCSQLARWLARHAVVSACDEEALRHALNKRVSDKMFHKKTSQTETFPNISLELVLVLRPVDPSKVVTQDSTSYSTFWRWSNRLTSHQSLCHCSISIKYKLQTTNQLGFDSTLGF